MQADADDADDAEKGGSETGDKDAGLQMDAGAVGLDVLEGLSEVSSLTGELLIFTGLLQVCALLSFCCCWRHFALRFLNQTCRANVSESHVCACIVRLYV